MMQTFFSRISTFTRFKLMDGTGPFVKVGDNSYENSNGDVIHINSMERVFSVPNEYKIGENGGSMANYQSYVARLDSQNSGLPTVTVLFSDFSPVWSHPSTGVFYATLADSFPAAKTAVFCSALPFGSALTSNGYVRDANTVEVDLFTDTYSNTDNGSFFIELRIYP